MNSYPKLTCSVVTRLSAIVLLCVCVHVCECSQTLQAEVNQHQSTLQQLMDLGRGMMGGASPEDGILIGDRWVMASNCILVIHVYY